MFISSLCHYKPWFCDIKNTLHRVSLVEQQKPLSPVLYMQKVEISDVYRDEIKTICISKKSVNWPSFSVDSILLKHENFGFALPIFPKNIENVPIYLKNYLKSSNVKLYFCLITVVFWQLCCLLLFRTRNGIFSYVLLPSKLEIFTNQSSKFPEFLQSENGNLFK